jgi:hypothetical protein
MNDREPASAPAPQPGVHGSDRTPWPEADQGRPRPCSWASGVGRTNAFYRQWRVLEGDPFYVSVE